MARTYLRSETLAEEVDQDTWIAVLRGIHRFEGRSSLRTWITGILIKRPRSMSSREGRHADFSVGVAESDRSSPTVPQDRFLVSVDSSLDGH
jgi:RNA polymerase sigma-70 factor (ECF subfamily)